MGSIGNNITVNTPVVERMDTGNLTESQRKVMDRAYNEIEFARTHTLEEYAMLQVTGYPTLEQAKKEFNPLVRWQDYGWDNEQKAVDYVLRRVNDRTESEYTQKYYEDLKNGRVSTRTSTSTLKALEKRGFIKVVTVGGTWSDTVQIIESRRR